MAEPEDRLLSRAHLDWIRDPATGQFDVILGGDVIRLGKTGLRDMTGSVSGITAGTVSLAREGDECNLGVRFIEVSEPSPTLFSLSALGFNEFIPQTHAVVPLSPSVAGVEPARLVVSPNNGNVVLNGAVPGVVYHGTAPYNVAQPWPTSLPGVDWGQTQVATA